MRKTIFLVNQDTLEVVESDTESAVEIAGANHGDHWVKVDALLDMKGYASFDKKAEAMLYAERFAAYKVAEARTQKLMRELNVY